MDTKPWYASKTVWSGIVTAVAGLYSALAVNHGFPAVPAWIYSILGAATVYSRNVATTSITK